MEKLIMRASTALAMGVSRDEIAAKLVESGATSEDAFLAVCAAEVLNKKVDNT